VRKFVTLGCFAAMLAGLVGCAAQGRRVAADTEAVLTHDFNPKDLQIIGRKAVDDLLKRDVLPKDKKPALYVARIANRTDEHVNADAISEYIATRMDMSGRIQLVEYSKAKDEAVKQLEFQQGAFVDPSTAKKVGKMVGADYFLQGELTNISVRAGRKKGQYFLFTLTLVDIQTLKSWKTMVEIQKLSKRGLFGW